MSITKQKMNQIVKEELNRALKQRGLNEMMGGRGPEHTPGTPEYRYRQALISSGLDPDDPLGNLPPAPPRPDYDLRGGYTPRRGSPFLPGEYAEYDRLREADDDMDMDTGIDVVPDDAMGGEDDMGMPMSGEEMEPVAAEIDWSEFEDEDTDRVGAAFFDALKQLREESPDEEPTAEAVVAMMQDLLSVDEDEDMGDEEMDDEGDFEDEAPMADSEEEGALNEWIQRTNLLAGTRGRR